MIGFSGITLNGALSSTGFTTGFFSGTSTGFSSTGFATGLGRARGVLGVVATGCCPPRITLAARGLESWSFSCAESLPETVRARSVTEMERSSWTDSKKPVTGLVIL